MGYWLDVQGIVVRFQTGTEIYFFSTVLGMIMGSRQPPIQYFPWAFSTEVKQPGSKADHSLPSIVIHIYTRIVSRLIMCVSIPPLFHIPPWSRV
jgi:hypothetical protein